MSGPRRGFAELPPQVVAEPRVRAAAGLPVTTRVLVTNRAAAPRVMSVTPVGLDAAWMPRPIRTRPVLPGHTVAVELTFVPAPGTVAADYPLSIAVQAIDPLRRAPTASTAIAETSLVVDASGQIGLEITPGGDHRIPRPARGGGGAQHRYRSGRRAPGRAVGRGCTRHALDGPRARPARCVGARARPHPDHSTHVRPPRALRLHRHRPRRGGATARRGRGHVQGILRAQRDEVLDDHPAVHAVGRPGHRVHPEDRLGDRELGQQGSRQSRTGGGRLDECDAKHGRRVRSRQRASSWPAT